MCTYPTASCSHSHPLNSLEVQSGVLRWTVCVHQIDPSSHTATSLKLCEVQTSEFFVLLLG